jgi:hypothetical protein
MWGHHHPSSSPPSPVSALPGAGMYHTHQVNIVLSAWVAHVCVIILNGSVPRSAFRFCLNGQADIESNKFYIIL